MSRPSPLHHRSALSSSIMPLLRSVVLGAARYPLETMSICLIIASSCYFGLIHFTDSPSHHYYHIQNSSTTPYIRIKQVIIDPPKYTPSSHHNRALSSSILRSAIELHNKISAIPVYDPSAPIPSQPYYWNDLCYRPVYNTSLCMSLSPLATWNHDRRTFDTDPDPLQSLSSSIREHLPALPPDAYVRAPVYSTDHLVSASSVVLTFVLDVSDLAKERLVDQWEQKLLDLELDNLHPLFRVPQRHSGSKDDGFFSEFVWTMREFIKTSSTGDLIVVAVSFVLMWATAYNLFANMRSVGSKFSLAFTVLISGVFSLMVSLVIAKIAGISLNMIQLGEAVPFLVVSIGFEKPYQLTKAIMDAEASDRAQTVGTRPAPVRDLVWRGVAAVAPALILDYVVEIGVLMLGSFLGIRGGLGEFCTVAALIVFFDCVFLFTLYTSVLSLKLELQRIREAAPVNSNDEKQHSDTDAKLSTSPRRTKRFDLISTDDATAIPVEKFTSTGSPVSGSPHSLFSRAKLILVLSFLAIHALNATASTSTAMDLSKRLRSEMGNPGCSAVVDWVSSASESAEEGKVITVELAPPYILFSIRYAKGEMVSQFPWTSMGNATLWFSIMAVLPVFAMVRRTVQRRMEESRSRARKVEEESSTAMSETKEVTPAPAPIKEPPVAFTTSTKTETSTTVKSFAIKHAQAECETSVNRNDSAVHIAERRGVGLVRTMEECVVLLKSGRTSDLTDEEVVHLAEGGKVAAYALEKVLGGDLVRAVRIRRILTSKNAHCNVAECDVPFEHYDYSRVLGQCCENVIGYIPIPLGVAGPLTIDGETYVVPMATTEGALIASTSRGCKALNSGGGATTVLVGDGMTRGPVVQFPSAVRAAACRRYLESDIGFAVVSGAFNSTSRFARLQRLKIAVAGRLLYIRFSTTTGDAMGMNMISKGVERALEELRRSGRFDDMRVLALSGNYCTDKKPASINWIEGRGKSVVAEATVPKAVVEGTLKTTVRDMVELNVAKNLVGSSIAGSVGGNNAQAANVVAAVFIATGQDPAQTVESAMCMTLMEETTEGDLYISCSMPCIEVGTIGGGTALGPQAACLEMLGVRGANMEEPGANARRLARVVSAAVMAAELSLCAALAAGHLVKSHMAHNRQQQPTKTV
ncbi:hydroxymethylglutaryl-coenzyme A reductase-domain-containing protein [Cladochytrium replicatum]|nr:hydroxymethylglutaryl-coenzyme A reductase-domain-containing protein [Cladochytrium replicatum]